MRASVSEKFSIGNMPAVVVLPYNNTVPEHLQGRSVMGRAEYHAYQGVILDGMSRIIWRGRHRKVCAATGTTRIRGKTYTGKVTAVLSDENAKSAALDDATKQLQTLRIN